jgi:hypothetical protein
MLLAIGAIWLVSLIALCSVAWFEMTRSSRERSD